MWRNPEIKRNVVIYSCLTAAVTIFGIYSLGNQAGFLLFGTCLIFDGLMLAGSAVRTRRIRRLSDRIDAVLHGKGSLDLSAYAEGELAAELEEDKRVSQIVAGQIYGYAYLEGGVNQYKPYLFLMGIDNEFAEEMPVHLISGRLPENPGEILIPQHVASNGAVHFDLGQEITLTVGRRVSGDGENLYQSTALICDDQERPFESIEGGSVSTYTVVGFYERPGFENFSAPGYTVLTVKDDPEGQEAQNAGAEDGLRYIVYIKTKNPAKITEIREDYGLRMEMNQSVLRFSGVLGDSEFGTMIYGFAAVVIGIIMFGSIALIYNAFAISVGERTRQYGLLASLGATKRQLRSSVLFEAAVVGAVGVPVGVAAGIAGIGVTLYLLRDMIQRMLGLSTVLRLHVSWLSVLAAVVVAAVTILLSAWIPAGRATRITPIEAVRQSGDVKIRPGEVRVSPVTYRLFGVEGMIGAKYFRRDRKRYRATILSLMMSIFLFISASALTMYMTDSINGRMEDSVAGFDLAVSVYENWDWDRMEKRRGEIEQVTGVEKTGYYVTGTGGQMNGTPMSTIMPRILRRREAW